MADRENVKIVISAALIVIVASMGIYAFIYRDKISQMLPNWQSKDGRSERVITDSPSIPEPPLMEDENLNQESSDQLSLNQDEETKDYPKIPNLDTKDSPVTKTDSNKGYTPPGIQDSPKTSIEPSEKKKTPQTETPEKKVTVYKAPLQEKSVQPKKEIIAKKKPVQQTQKIQKKQTKATKSSGYKKKVAKKSPSTKTTTQQKMKPSKSVASNQKLKATKPESSSLDARIKRLESKLNVHMQDTDSRLNSLEKRIEKLEKNLSTP
ncbi:MAG: hypothetical protein JJT78_02585 [Leptospira sp.]|nr:hypothetical protein [Leptospira sp.]